MHFSYYAVRHKDGLRTKHRNTRRTAGHRVRIVLLQYRTIPTTDNRNVEWARSHVQFVVEILLAPVMNHDSNSFFFFFKKKVLLKFTIHKNVPFC
jgi:hypothetical protein